MNADNTDSIWSRTFAYLCVTQLLAYAHNALLTPTIPLYVTHLGGSAFFVGLVLAAFATTSVLLRPLIGDWADRRSEAAVLTVGCLILGGSLLVFFIPLAAMAMLANGLRGIGWAGLNTGGYALLARIAPITRRGEASGYYTAFQSSVSVLFPALALWLVDAPFGGFRAVLLLSAAVALLGGGFGQMLGRSTASRGGDVASRGAGETGAGALVFLERDVLLPSALLFCLNVTHPAVTGFLVLYAREMGIENVAWYFVFGGATSLLARPALGRVADVVGWGRSLALGFLFQIFALVLLAVASNLAMLIIAGVLYSLGSAIGSSTTLALAIQRANPQRRGRAMASFSVAYPLSAGIGALLAGGSVEIAGYFWMYVAAAALGCAGLFVTAVNWSKLRRD